MFQRINSSIHTLIVSAGALSVLVAPALRANAQDVAIPAVDDSPSAQLMIDQALDQSKANPRESVRLLTQALDAGADRLVKAGADPDLFTPVSRRVHAMLMADPVLLVAYRREVSPDADLRLARGELEELIATRLDTDAGLEAALRLSQSLLTRGKIAAAASFLDRVSDHDLLTGRRRLYHASMTAATAERLGQFDCARRAREEIESLSVTQSTALNAAEVAGARLAAATQAPSTQSAQFGLLQEGRYSRAQSAESWQETWGVQLETVLKNATEADADGNRLLRIDRVKPPALSAPACVAERVFVDDGYSLRAFDRLSGRPLWMTPSGADESAPAALRLVAATEDAVVSFTSQSGQFARPNAGRISCMDPTTGLLRWEARIDRLDTQVDLEGIQPQGMPLMIDGRVIVAARRTSTRLETVSWLISIDLEQPRPAAWARVIATSGSVRFGTLRTAESPIVAGGVIYMSTSTGAVVAIDPWDGLIRWLRRSPVPVRDLGSRGEPADFATPAVVGGRVLAISPDRSRIRSFDARTGQQLSEIPTGTDGDIGTPSYLVGDDASGLVLAVGTHVTCFRAIEPEVTLWSYPASNALSSGEVHGRVQFARTDDPSSPVLLYPEQNDAVVRDGRTGTERMRIVGAGNANSLLVGNQLLSVGPSRISGWMPPDEAERIVRGRMQASQSIDEAVALLHLARQLRSGKLAAEAASEVVRRMATLTPADPARAEAFELILVIDALEITDGADRVSLDAAVDQAALVAQNAIRGGFARAERAMRRRDPAAAARIAATVALACESSELLPVRGGLLSVDARARGIIAAALLLEPRAASEVDRVVAKASSQASATARPRILRTAARIGAGTTSGAAALETIIAAADSTSARIRSAQLVQECVALGTTSLIADEFLRSLNPSWGAQLVGRKPVVLPKVDGTATSAVQFPGRLPRTIADAPPLTGGLLVMQGTDMVMRTPAGVVSWRLPVSSEDCSVLRTSPSILICEDGVGGAGKLFSISPTGSLLWSSQPRVDAVADVPDPSNFDGESRQQSTPLVVPLPSAPAVAILRRDGAITAYNTQTGAELWRHAADGSDLLAWTSGPLAIATGVRSDDGSGPSIVISAFDPIDGSPMLRWRVDSATELKWMKVVDGGLLVVATEVGIEARRLSGGDEQIPYWMIDSPTTQSSTQGWALDEWLLIRNQFESLVAINAWSGQLMPNAFAVPSSSGFVVSANPVRQIARGDDWFGMIRDDRVDFYSRAGEYLGRNAPGFNCAFVAAASSASRLFVLDAGGNDSNGAIVRLDTLLRDFDARQGGLEVSSPILLRTLGQRLQSIAAFEGGIAVSNGSMVQLIPFSTQQPSQSR